MADTPPMTPCSTDGAAKHPSMLRVDGLWVHRGVPGAGGDWDRVIDNAREERHRQLIGDAFSPRNDEPGL